MEHTTYEKPTTDLLDNVSTETPPVFLRNILESEDFQNSRYELPVAIGQTPNQQNVITDLSQMPHLIVAGAGAWSERWTMTNAIIASLLLKKKPSELKLVLIDTCLVNFSVYESIGKHFLAKPADQDEFVDTDSDVAIRTLNSLQEEIDERHELLREAKSRNLKEYNRMLDEGKLDANKYKRLPYIVVIIHEYVDFALQYGRKVETLIGTLAQKSHNKGIHIILSIGRPQRSVITGIINACFPSRISFHCDPKGSELLFHGDKSACHLTGNGDMLINFGQETIRMQSAWVSEEEIKRITEHISRQNINSEAYLLPNAEKSRILREEIQGKALDPLLPSVAEHIVTKQDCSTSQIQRSFCIGYNRACRITDHLESIGIIGPVNGSSPRKILVSNLDDLKKILAATLSSETNQ